MKKSGAQSAPELDSVLGALAAPRVPLYLRERVISAATLPADASELAVCLGARVRPVSLLPPLLIMGSLCLFVFALIGSISAGYPHDTSRGLVYTAPRSREGRLVRFLPREVAIARAVPVLVGRRTRAELQQTVVALAALEVAPGPVAQQAPRVAGTQLLLDRGWPELWGRAPFAAFVLSAAPGSSRGLTLGALDLR